MDLLTLAVVMVATMVNAAAVCIRVQVEPDRQGSPAVNFPVTVRPSHNPQQGT
jgi:hypothetical protein